MNLDELTQEFSRLMLERLPGLQPQNLTVGVNKEMYCLAVKILLPGDRYVTYRKMIAVIRQYRGPLSDIVDMVSRVILDQIKAGDPEEAATLAGLPVKTEV